jgi:cell wall-associated NlpC family hydrolase/phage-related protein
VASIVDAFLRLRVDRSKVKDDVEKGIDSADTRGAGTRAGRQFGTAFAAESGGRQRDGLGKFVASHKVAGRAAGKSFGDEFSIQFTGTVRKTLAAIGPGILGMGLKGGGILTGGGLLAGMLPAAGLAAGAGGVAAAGAGAIGIGAKTLIGDKQAMGPLYAQAQQVAAAFTKAMQAAAAPMLKPLQDAFAQIPKMLAAITPALQSAFAGAATLIQPLLAGVQTLATTVLPMLGQAFRAVAPLLQPMIGGLTQLIAGIMPGLITLLRAAAPAVQALAGFLGILGQGLGQMLAAFAPALAASSSLISSLGSVLATLLPVLAQIAGAFAQALAPAFAAFAAVLRALAPFLVMLGQLLADIARAMLDDLTWALRGVATLFTAIRPALEAFMRALSGIFTVLENSGVFQVLGAAIVALAKPLGDMISALLTGLVPILPPIVKFVGDLAAMFAGALSAAIAAIIPPLTKLAVEVLAVIAQLLPVLLPLFSQMAATLTGAMVSAIQALVPPLARLADEVLTAMVALLPAVVPLITTLLQVFTTVAAGVITGVAAALAAIISATPPEVIYAIVAAFAAWRLAVLGMAVVQGVIAAFEAFKGLCILTRVELGLLAVQQAAIAVATKAWAAVQWLLNAALTANPIGIVVVALAALAAAIYLAWTHSATFRDILIAVFGTVKGAALAVANWFSGPFVNFFVTAWNTIRTTTTTVWNAIAGFFTTVWNSIRNTVTTVVGAISGFLTASWNGISGTARTIWAALAAFFTAWWNTLNAQWRGLVAALAAFLAATWNAVSATARAVWNALGAFFAAWWGALNAQWRAVVGGITGFLAAAWNGISGTARAVWNGLAGFFTGWWGALRGEVTAAANGIAGVLAGVWNAIRNTAVGAWNGIKGAISAVWTGIKDVIRAPLVIAAGVWNLFAKGVNAVAGLFGVKPVPVIAGFAQGGRIPGYGGGDILPFAVKGGGAAMLEPGETIVSKESSRLPYMRAAFSAAGVPGYQLGGIVGRYQLGGIVGFFGGVVRDALEALIPGGKIALDAAKKVAGMTLDLAKIGSGYWPDLIKQVIASLGAGVKKGVEAGATAVLASMGGGNSISDYAESFLGKIPYVWGGASPKGADCSGFVQFVYSRFGINAPRTSEAQGAWVKRADPSSGGLAFYHSPPGGPDPGHVAIIKNAGTVISQGGGMGPVLMGLHGMPLLWTGVPPGGFGGAGGQVAGGSALSAQAYARSRMGDYGWSGADMSSLVLLWNGESGWRWNASNPQSGAYGIPQALPGSKMASSGADWRTNPNTQVNWGLGYIKGRYGTPSAAYAAWMSRSPHWYGKGGLVRAFANGGRLPEPVLGIGASGAAYSFDRGEEVQSRQAAQATADHLALVVGRLDKLIATAAAIPAGVGRSVGGAIGGASSDAAFRSRYPRGGF